MTDLEFFEALATMARLATDYDLANEATIRARAARAASAQHVFQIEPGGTFTVDGMVVRKRSRGLAVACLVLGCHQTRTPMPDASAMFLGKHAARRAWQAVQRAADAVAQVSPSAEQHARGEVTPWPAL